MFKLITINNDHRVASPLATPNLHLLQIGNKLSTVSQHILNYSENIKFKQIENNSDKIQQLIK